MPETIAPGINHATINMANGGRIEAIVVDHNAGHVKVISSISTSNAREYGFDVGSTMTLSDYYQSTKPLAVLSGGFLSSFSPPLPLGQIVIDGNLVSQPHISWLTTGMFCASENGYFVEEFNPKKKIVPHSDCIQSGPLLIKNNEVRYDSNYNYSTAEMDLVKPVKDQAFVCVTRDGNLILGVSTPSRLDEFSHAVKTELQCANALGLTTFETAGLYYQEKLVGHDELPLTSVIAIFASSPVPPSIPSQRPAERPPAASPYVPAY